MENNEQPSIIDDDPYKIIANASAGELEAFRTARWYVDCGDDDFLAGSKVDIFLLMREKGIPMKYRMRAGGHNWEYWQECLRKVLRFISAGFAE